MYATAWKITDTSQRVTPPQVKAQHPFVTKYETAWPVKTLMRQYMNNHRQHQRKVNTNNTGQDLQTNDTGTATSSAETTAKNSANNGDGDEDSSDLSISDVD
jgi:hypothetical protein